MARLSQADVKAKADEWALLADKVRLAENKKNAELDPFVVEFNEKTKGIVTKHDRKIGLLVEQRVELEEEITDWLEAQGKVIALSGDLAVAANELQVGSRKIDAENFFAKVTDRSAAFWECITVAIAKAEKYLGKDKVDDLSSKSSKLVATLKLK